MKWTRGQETIDRAADRLGGKVLPHQFDGFAVDTGPDSLPVRPFLMALLEDLRLTDAVVSAAPLVACVWSRGKLRRLPAPAAGGVQDRTEGWRFS